MIHDDNVPPRILYCIAAAWCSETCLSLAVRDSIANNNNGNYLPTYGITREAPPIRANDAFSIQVHPLSSSGLPVVLAAGIRLDH